MHSFISRIRRHRNLLWLAVSALLIPLLQDLAGNWLTATFGETPARILQIFSALVLVAFLIWLLYATLGKEAPIEIVAEERRPPRHPGLITLVSHKSPVQERLPAHEFALRYHLAEEAAGGDALRHCWLLATGGASGTVPEARRLRDVYGERCRIVIKEIRDPFDLYETYKVVQAIYVEAQTGADPLQAQEIIGDFTGGTTPMSAGVTLACHGNGPMQYIQGGTEKFASVPIWVRMGTDASV